MELGPFLNNILPKISKAFFYLLFLFKLSFIAIKINNDEMILESLAGVWLNPESVFLRGDLRSD